MLRDYEVIAGRCENKTLFTHLRIEGSLKITGRKTEVLLRKNNVNKYM